MVRRSRVCRATITVTAGIPSRTAAIGATGEGRASNIRKNAPARVTILVAVGDVSPQPGPSCFLGDDGDA